MPVLSTTVTELCSDAARLHNKNISSEHKQQRQHMSRYIAIPMVPCINHQ